MMIGRRAYRLNGWLVRALLPSRHIGSYTLFKGREPRYTGRSDRDLARRLRSHARAAGTDYFAFDVHPSPERAFVAESASFHVAGHLDNRIHPATPHGSTIKCPFCMTTRRVEPVGRPGHNQGET